MTWLWLACAPEAPDGPAPVAFHPLRRLTHAEYANTLKDLLYLDAPPETPFPAEVAGPSGYDNDASTLTVSPLLVELYAQTVDEVLADVFEPEAEVTSTQVYEAEGPGPGYDGGFSVPSGYAFADPGALTVALPVEHDGEYRITVTASGTAPDPEPPRVTVSVDGAVVGSADAAVDPADLPFTAILGEGTAQIEVRFANPSDAGVLTVDAITFEGPLDPEVGWTPAYDRLIGWCDPVATGERACAEQVLASFVPRAWRRPLREGELAWILDLYDEATEVGSDHPSALRAAFELVLLSEDFLFRLEGPPPGEVTPVDPHALAVRLSYFLWSSMPDEALFAAADDGSLAQPEVLAATVERMMLDPRADALVTRFAAQWLGVTALDDVAPIYPAFDEPLREAMVTELSLVLGDHVLGDAPLDALLTRETTYADPRLAAFYGAPHDGDAWQEVSLSGASRRGVLTTAGFLTAHSHPDQPSTVARGRWILENVLCAEVPPPPPAVTPPPVDDAGLSVRELEEAQRQAPGTACAACHAGMDPWGHAMGRYDGIGALRSVDERGAPIDAAISVPEGSFASILDAVAPLAADPRFTDCFAREAWRYALGRAPAASEEPAVAASVEALAATRSFRALVTEIVLSEPFRSSAPAGSAR